MSQSVNPVLVEVIRGDMVESFHRGAAAVFDANGRNIAGFGDIDRPIYPRSAIKPLQAFVLVESGALEHYRLGLPELALACASHSGESCHTDGIRQWLDRLGLNETALECGAHYPAHRDTRIAMTRNDVKAGAIHNNCSGKHTGFLSVACHAGEPVAGYIERNHPVQQRVLRMLQDLSGAPVDTAPAGFDGCGIPVVGMSLQAIAGAFAALAAANFASAKRRVAAGQICEAMANYPNLVGGTDRLCTYIPVETKGQVLIKVGAEGVYAGMVMGDKPLGMALKIDDGSRRAAEVAMTWLIKEFSQLEGAQIEKLNTQLRPEIKTVAKRSAGLIRPAIDL